MHEFHFLSDVIILLAISVANVVISKRLKLSPVLGYLILGTMIGKYGFALIQNPEYASHLSEFGVIFLLFAIGLELTFERLIQMRLLVFGFGGLQLVITTAVLAVAISVFFNFQAHVAVVLAGALALSSTAIVLQVLYEGKRQSTQVGRLSLSVLLMQDFAVVPLLAILPIVAVGEGNLLPQIGAVALKALGAIIVITILGRVLLRPFFSIIGSANSEEVYVATTLLLVLGAAVLTEEWGLSSAMGAFIAGILIAETQYRSKIEASIMPFKSLFLGLFFLSVGMSINVNTISENIDMVFIGTIALLVIKASIIFLLCKLFRFRTGTSIHAALLLSQGGEFAFILFNMAMNTATNNPQMPFLLDQETGQLMLVVVSITMAITPLLSMFGAWVEDRLDSGQIVDKNQEFKGVSDLDAHIIIGGFGRVGRVISYMLAERQYNYIAIDGDLSVVKKARKQGYQVYHGDLSTPSALKAVGIERASAVVLTMNDKQALRKTVKNISQNYDGIEIITRAEDSKHGKGLKRLGAAITVPSTIETGLQIGGALLKQLGVAEHDIFSIKEQFRGDSYSFTEEIELFRGIGPSKVTSSE